MQVFKQSQLRKYRVSEPGTVYAITQCQQLGSNSELTTYSEFPEKIIETFLFCQQQQWMKVAAFIVMPDHYHFVAQLGTKKSLAQLMHSINTYTARFIAKRANVTLPFWQGGYYDHIIRNELGLIKQMKYIEENPVRASLVERVSDWPYSSASNQWHDAIDRSWLL